MRETDMYEAIKEYFVKDGFLVRSEVRSIDVVAVKGEILVGIEMKKGLTMDLLIQGTLRQRTCDLVFLAVPKPKRIVKDKGMKNLLYLLKRLELGLLYVDIENNAIIEIQVPVFYDLNKGRRSSLKERMRILKETGRRSIDGNQGGSTGKKLLTAYREDSLRAVALMKLNDVISPKILKSKGLNATLLNKNYYNWFVKVDHGKYTLNFKQDDYREYDKLIASFMLEYHDLDQNSELIMVKTNFKE